MNNIPHKHIPSPKHYAAKHHTTANAAPTHHMSSTDTTPEQGGTFRALYMAMTKTKPPQDSSHTTPSSNRNKPCQMICSKAHQGGANKTPKWIITRKDPPKPPSTTFANLYCARARAASGKPPEEVIAPVIKNPKPQWQVVYLGWGKPHPNVGISIPDHPNYVAPPQTTIYPPRLHLVRSRRLGLNHNLDTSLTNWQTSPRTMTTSPSKMSHMRSIIWKKMMLSSLNLHS
jgi:hypothetical protein